MASGFRLYDFTRADGIQRCLLNLVFILIAIACGAVASMIARLLITTRLRAKLKDKVLVTYPAVGSDYYWVYDDRDVLYVCGAPRCIHSSKAVGLFNVVNTKEKLLTDEEVAVLRLKGIICNE